MSYYQFKILKVHKLCHGILNRSHGKVYPFWRFNNKIKRNLEKISGLNYQDFYYCEQVHGTKIINISENNQQQSLEADGLMTTKKNKLLLVKHADCVPIFLYDPQKNVICLIHSGWKGTLGKIGLAALVKMINYYGSKSRDILVGIGPAAKNCCYGPFKNSKQFFFQNLPEWKPYINETSKQWKINLTGFIKQMFLDAGVLKKNIEVANICTICNQNYHSHTRQRDQGEEKVNGISFIGLKK